MPRYFFDVYDTENRPDLEGTDCSCLDVARTEALKAAGAMVAEQPAVWRGQPWKMEVRDDSGIIVARLDFIAS